MVAMSSFVTAASVITAGVTFTVVVMRTHESFTRNQVPRQIRSDCIFDRTFGPANYLDAILGQGIDRATANASANQYVNMFSVQQSGKRTMSGISARNDTGRDDLPALAIVDCELRRVSKMLEYSSVFTGYGNFHVVSFFFIDSVRI